MDKHRLVKMSETSPQLPSLRDLHALLRYVVSHANLYSKVLDIIRVMQQCGIPVEFYTLLCQYNYAFNRACERYKHVNTERYNPVADDLYRKAVALIDCIKQMAEAVRSALLACPDQITQEYGAHFIVIERIIELMLEQSATCLHEVDQITPNRVYVWIILYDDSPTPSPPPLLPAPPASSQGAGVSA